MYALEACGWSWVLSMLCSGVLGSISPWVTLNSMNNTDPNSQYHNFHMFTNDSHPDWYFESMTIMHWNNCIGYIGLTPKEIKCKANSGSSLGIYDRLICDLTNYIEYSPVAITLLKRGWWGWVAATSGEVCSTEGLLEVCQGCQGLRRPGHIGRGRVIQSLQAHNVPALYCDFWPAGVDNWP